MSVFGISRQSLYSHCMASLNITIPDELREFVEKRTKESHYATPAEYICSLVRDDQNRVEQEKLERLLIEGLESGTPIDVPDLADYFSRKERGAMSVREFPGRSKK